MTTIIIWIIIHLWALSAQAAPSNGQQQWWCNTFCPEPQDKFLPICASDGKSYDNDCELSATICLRKAQDQDELDIIHVGQCYNCHECHILPYSPICGSDDQTYANDCEFQCARYTKAYLQMIHWKQCRQATVTFPLVNT
jgi:hypothetical protein